MTASNEPNLPKILIACEEFQRLKLIESKYLESQANKHSKETHLSHQVPENIEALSDSETQAGAGALGDVVTKQIADFVLQKVWDNLPFTKGK